MKEFSWHINQTVKPSGKNLSLASCCNPSGPCPPRLQGQFSCPPPSLQGPSFFLSLSISSLSCLAAEASFFKFLPFGYATQHVGSSFPTPCTEELNPYPPVLKAQSLNHWTTRKVSWLLPISGHFTCHGSCLESSLYRPLCHWLLLILHAQRTNASEGLFLSILCKLGLPSLASAAATCSQHPSQ